MTTRDHESIALIDLSYLFTRDYRSAGIGASPNAAAYRTLEECEAIRRDVSHAIICLDAPPYRRRDRYAKYKDNREEKPPEERAQLRSLVKELRRRGFRTAYAPGYEADDIVATLAKAYSEWCADVRIVCPDKDAAQCVTERVVQFIPAVGSAPAERRDMYGVQKKFGVLPRVMPFYQALMGDRDDNVPGVPGIGKKRALDVIAALTAEGKGATLIDLAELLATGKQEGLMWKAIAEHWEDLRLSLELVTLETDAPVDVEDLLLPHKPEPARPDVPDAPPGIGLDGFMGNDTPLAAPPEPPPPPPPPSMVQPTRLTAEQIELELERLAPLDAAKKGTPHRQSEQPGFVSRFEPGFAPVNNPTKETLVNELHRQKAEPIIGKDPNADQFLRQAAAEREAAQNNRHADLPPTERQQENEERRESEQFEQEKMRERPRVVPPPAAQGPGLAKATPRSNEEVSAQALALSSERYGLTTTSLDPLDLRAAWTECNWIAKGGLYKGYDTPEKVFTCMIRAKELGIKLGTALAGFYPMEGKLAPSADLIRSLAERDPNCEYFFCESSDATQATWVTKHKKHPTERRFQYTIEDAREVPEYWKKDRWGNDGNWVKRPKEMLSKTAGSKLAREVYPGACNGLYCPEEMTGDIINTVGIAA